MDDGEPRRARGRRAPRALWLGVTLCALIACTPTARREVPTPPAPLADRSDPSTVPPVSAWPYTFSVVSYNAFLLPESWFGGDPELRARALVDRLAGYDAVVLQELFDDGARATLLAGLAAEYPHATRMVGRAGPFPREEGGVMVLSRWPIEAQAQVAFGELCASVDCLADKGAIYARIVKGGRRYHLVGTHAQSDAAGRFPEVRRAQFRRIAAFIAALDPPADEPLVLAGDFNVDCHDPVAFERMLGALRAVAPRPCGDRFTWDGLANARAYGRLQVSLDHVLLGARHPAPQLAWSGVRALRAPEAQGGDLSDHHAAEAAFVFGPLPDGSAERAAAPR